MRIMMALNAGFATVNGLMFVADHDLLNAFACAFAVFVGAYVYLKRGGL